MLKYIITIVRARMTIDLREVGGSTIYQFVIPIVLRGVLGRVLCD